MAKKQLFFGAVIGGVTQGVGAILNADKQRRMLAEQNKIRNAQAFGQAYEAGVNELDPNRPVMENGGDLTFRNKLPAYSNVPFSDNLRRPFPKAEDYKDLPAEQSFPMLRERMADALRDQAFQKEIQTIGMVPTDNTGVYEYVGPSHAGGGIPVDQNGNPNPNGNIEVEGGETKSGNTVFTDRLTMADVSKMVSGGNLKKLKSVQKEIGEMADSGQLANGGDVPPPLPNVEIEKAKRRYIVPRGVTIDTGELQTSGALSNTMRGVGARNSATSERGSGAAVEAMNVLEGRLQEAMLRDGSFEDALKGTNKDLKKAYGKSAPRLGLNPVTGQKTANRFNKGEMIVDGRGDYTTITGNEYYACGGKMKKRALGGITDATNQIVNNFESNIDSHNVGPSNNPIVNESKGFDISPDLIAGGANLIGTVSSALINQRQGVEPTPIGTQAPQLNTTVNVEPAASQINQAASSMIRNSPGQANKMNAYNAQLNALSNLYGDKANREAGLENANLELQYRNTLSNVGNINQARSRRVTDENQKLQNLSNIIGQSVQNIGTATRDANAREVQRDAINQMTTAYDPYGLSSKYFQSFLNRYQ